MYAFRHHPARWRRQLQTVSVGTRMHLLHLLPLTHLEFVEHTLARVNRAHTLRVCGLFPCNATQIPAPTGDARLDGKSTKEKAKLRAAYAAVRGVVLRTSVPHTNAF